MTMGTAVPLERRTTAPTRKEMGTTVPLEMAHGGAHEEGSRVKSPATQYYWTTVPTFRGAARNVHTLEPPRPLRVSRC